MAKNQIVTTKELFGEEEILSTEELFGDEILSTEEVLADPIIEKPPEPSVPKQLLQRALERVGKLRAEKIRVPKPRVPAERRVEIGAPEIPEEVPKLEWTRAGIPTETRFISPEMIGEPLIDYTAKQEKKLAERARNLATKEFEMKYPPRAGTGYLVTPRERNIMYIASVTSMRNLLPSVLGGITRKVPAFGRWVMRHPVMGRLLERSLEGGIAGALSKRPEDKFAKEAVEGAVTHTAWSLATEIAPAYIKLALQKAKPEVVKPPLALPAPGKPPVPEVTVRPPVVPKPAPLALKPPVKPIPAVPAIGEVISTEELAKPIVAKIKPIVPPAKPTLPEVGKPPILRSPEQAKTYGESIKGNKELIQDLKDERERLLGESIDIVDRDKKIQILTRAQHYREAIQVAEVKPPVVKPVPKPPVKPVAKPPAKVPAKPPAPVPGRREVTIFPKGKRDLITDIKKAIVEVPKKVSEFVGFQIDGGFKIKNTKEALGKFLKEVKKTPEKMVIGELRVPRKPTAPRKAYIPQTDKLMTLEKRGGWTDGAMMDLEGEAPKPVQSLPKLKKRTVPDEHFDEIIKNAKKAAILPVDKLTTNAVPAPVGKVNPFVVLFKKPDGKIIELNKEYHDYFVNKYGSDVVFKFQDKVDTPILVEHKGKVKGVVMPKEYKAKEQYIKLFEEEIEETQANRITQIMRGAKTMAEAQQQIKKDLKLDIPIADLKAFEPQVKGGLPPEAQQHIIKDLSEKIKGKERKDVMNFGVSEVADISPEDLVDSMTFFDRAKDYTSTKYKQLGEAIHSLELAQNYLYSYADSKPIAEGVIDAQVKQLRSSNDVDEAIRIINKATNKSKVAEILVEADKKERLDGDIDNVISKVNAGIEKGTMTQKDKEAIRAFGSLRKVVKEQIIKDILDSRVGIRIKSDGIRYDLTYTNNKGKLVKRRGVTEITLDRLQRMHRDVKITDQNERVKFRHLDPNTGKYVTRTEYIKDYDEVTKILGKETKELINETLPYVNWIPHNRIHGKFWVEAYEPHATGEGETKIFSARVPNKVWADKMQAKIKQSFPSARVLVKPHSLKMKYMPSFGSMVEVSHYLHNAGVDPRSEAGQKIINAYRSMSGLMSSLIHSQNLAGYRVDFDGLVEGMERKATAAVNRGFRQEIKDLTGLTKEIKDDFRYNTATKYINALSSVTEGNVVLDAAKALTYFWVLANKTTYVVQNLTESLWALARVPKLNKPFKFMTPLPREYKVLVDKARNEGIIRPFYGEQLTGRGLLHNINILGNWSENESSKRVFEIGLRVARDKGLTGDEAYREAYQFLFNVGKPYYRNPNTIVALLGREGTVVNKYGFIFLRWVLDWINKFARAPVSTKIKTMLVWFLLGGAGTLPFGRKILHKTGLVDIRKDPKRLTLTEKFMLGGLPGTIGVSSRFLIPMFYKGLGDVRTGVERGFNILSSQIKRGKVGWGKYGLIGALGALPLGGFQYPISGITKVKKGIVEVRGEKKKVVYKPKTPWAKFITGVGLTPFELSQIYAQKKEPRPKPKVFR